MKGEEVALEIRRVSKTFTGTYALKEVSVSFSAGEVHAVVGENGAGKSTLMKILAGVYRPSGGEIVFRGAPYSVKNPYEAQQAGISIIFQEFSLIRNFTVLENVFLNREHAGRLGFLNKAEAKRALQSLLEEIGIELDIDKEVGRLTVVQQQVVEIVKALSVDAQVLIMDEPTSALTDVEVKKLFDLIRYLKKKNVTIIYISHMLDEVFRIADRVTVLKDGEVVGTRPVGELDKGELVRMMVGRKIEDYFPDFGQNAGETVLEVRDLSLEGKLHGISFTLRAGEVLGVAGMMGSGRSLLVECLLGLRRKTGGAVLLNGKPFEFLNVRDAVTWGMGYVSEDRKNLGILGPLSVRENITIASLDRYTRMGFLNVRGEAKDSEAQVGLLSIKTSGISQRVEELSGGNQQKVLISRWLLRNPRIFIFSEPTRGIDVGAKAEIYKIIRDLTSRGGSVLMVSSELPEILGMSNRILVMRSGRVGGIVDQAAGRATEEEIMSIAVGHEYAISK